jgi:hypothetical protein
MAYCSLPKGRDTASDVLAWLSIIGLTTNDFHFGQTFGDISFADPPLVLFQLTTAQRKRLMY